MLKWIADSFRYWFAGMKFHSDPTNTPIVLVWDRIQKSKDNAVVPHKPTAPAGPKEFLEDNFIVRTEKRKVTK